MVEMGRGEIELRQQVVAEQILIICHYFDLLVPFPLVSRW